LWTERERLRSRRLWAGAAGLFILGITPYLYLPLRSRLNPVFVWSPIRNLSDLWDHISGREYGPRMFSFPLFMVLGNLKGYARLLWGEFGIGLALLLTGIWALRRDVGLLGLLGATWALDVAFGANYDVSDVEVFFLPSLFAVALVVARGLAWAWGRVRFRAAIAVLSAFLPAWGFSAHFHRCDLHNNRIARKFGEDVLHNLAPGALLLTRGDDMAFILLYLQKVEGVMPNVTVVSRNSRALSEPYGPDYRWLSPRDKALRRRWRELKWLSKGKRPVYYEVKADVPAIPRVRPFPDGLVFRALREGEDVPDPLEFWRRCDIDSLERLPFHKDIWVRKILSNYRLAQGEAYLAAGDTARAAAAFERMAELVPDSKTVQHNVGVLFYRLGDLEEAREHLLRAVRLDPRNAGARYLLGRSFERLGAFQEALSWYREALRWGFPEDRVFDAMGAVYAEMGRIEEARRWWRRALEVNPYNAEARRNLSESR
ncbi:MAG TPA: tetratricopeptide repeat protein, partial [Candidatus Latescibacteria bacterium]|nr:tetratricopeptide repeat protein [Candidatus Latescibacterota bacterium]